MVFFRLNRLCSRVYKLVSFLFIWNFPSSSVSAHFELDHSALTYQKLQHNLTPKTYPEVDTQVGSSPTATDEIEDFAYNYEDEAMYTIQETHQNKPSHSRANKKDKMGDMRVIDYNRTTPEDSNDKHNLKNKSFRQVIHDLAIGTESMKLFYIVLESGDSKEFAKTAIRIFQVVISNVSMLPFVGSLFAAMSGILNPAGGLFIDGAEPQYPPNPIVLEVRHKMTAIANQLNKIQKSIGSLENGFIFDLEYSLMRESKAYMDKGNMALMHVLEYLRIENLMHLRNICDEVRRYPIVFLGILRRAIKNQRWPEIRSFDDTVGKTSDYAEYQTFIKTITGLYYTSLIIRSICLGAQYYNETEQTQNKVNHANVLGIQKWNEEMYKLTSQSV